MEIWIRSLFGNKAYDSNINSDFVTAWHGLWGPSPVRISKMEVTVMKKIGMVILSLFLTGLVAQAQELIIPMYRIDRTGVGDVIGTVKATSSPYGTILMPDLKNLTPGLHGFHVHQNPNCSPGEKSGKMIPGLAAGGHYDPSGSGKHAGPYGNGHLGDLPALYVDGNGQASHPVLAPRLKLSDLKGRSLMIHAGGDNYADTPKKLGGGGARMACGVVE
jgi:Cu-Zn family superoxide dismutase